MVEKLTEWLRKNYPRDVLMPLEKGAKRPSFAHKNRSWSWYRFINRKGDQDIGILLVDLCVVDIDCHSVASVLEDRFKILKTVPCESTSKGRHYYFSRSKKADINGHYDGIKQRNAKIDFKTICSNGTSGVVAVSPSTGKAWLPDRAPWMSHSGGRLPEIPDDLLEHISRPQHTPISCTLHFLVDGERRDVSNCNVLAGSAYLDIFVRDPLTSEDSGSCIIPIPKYGAGTFDDMVAVCATGELWISQSEILNSDSERFRERLESICGMADFLGMPIRFDKYFRAPFGYLWRCIRLHESSRCLSAVAMVESTWRYQLGAQKRYEGDWRRMVVEITPEVSNRIRYRPIELVDRESFLFNTRASMDSVFEVGDTMIHSNPDKLDLPSIVDEILNMARGCIMLAGGSMLGLVAKNCPPGADHDFFVFGIDSKRASEIVDDISTMPNVKETFRSENAITFKTGDHLFQVITKLFRNPAEILHGFDISASKIGLYRDERGRRHLLATPSWVECMRCRTIWVDDRIWSRSSAVRLCKYYCKGFDVLIPGVRRSLLDRTVDLLQNLKTFDGIALLFAMESQLDEMYKTKQKSIGSRISSQCLETMIRTKMRGHATCDYTAYMKTTRLLSYVLRSFRSAFVSKTKDESPVLVWSEPTVGQAVCGTFALFPANLKGILLDE